jgi:hypothetical protein
MNDLFETGRAGSRIHVGDAVYITARYRWLPKWFMRWSWFRVVKHLED